uniref:Protein kinase domain-containing protein n=1 Tax=Panagrolaimus sp. ES5 TaxID=591445 RepID=A0AC34FL84_9BILA
MDSADKSSKKSKKSVVVISTSQKVPPGNGDSASGKKIKIKVSPIRKKKQPDVPSAKKSSSKKVVCKSDDNVVEKKDRSSKRERKRSSNKFNEGSQKGKPLQSLPIQPLPKKPEKHRHHQKKDSGGENAGGAEKENNNNNLSEEEESGKGSGRGGGSKGNAAKQNNKRKKDNGEIKLVKEAVAVLKNSAQARDENEMSDVEAEQPKNKPDKTIVKRGGRLEIGDSIYEIIDGSVLGDYGNCNVREVGKDELLTFRYESISSKCKRIKIECTVLVCGAATQKTHMLRKKDNGEIKLVKEAVAVLKNSAQARDENEMSDVEAEQPKNKPDKTIVKRGGRLEIGDSIYEIIDGSVLGDYGNCNVREVGKDELLTFRYESISSKCKRIKIECTVLVCGAATQKTHMLRLLLRGTIDNFKLRYLITDALGYSIPDLLTQLSLNCFSLPSALRLAHETFESLEELHKINFIHRDIKPAAFAFGLKSLNTKLFLTHFGLAKKFRGSADAKLLAPRKTVPFMGTVKYASRTCHERGERSRKDDIESWVFMISEFVDEKALSWRKIVNRDEINFIHRDIKPAAFAFGLKSLNTKLFLTHFGLAKKFRGSADAKLLAPRKTVPFMGTVKYASRTCHERGERSRKDDIESWVFMISEFVDEKALSWRKIVNRDEILKEKCIFMSDEGISHLYSKHKKMPDEFRPLIHYVMSLEFSSSPDYLYIKKILREAMEKKNVSQNDPWEWEGLEEANEEAKKRKNNTCDSTQQIAED